MRTIILGAAAAATLALTAGAASAQPYGDYGQRGYYDRGDYSYGYDNYRRWRDSDRDGTPDRREWNRDRDCDGRPDQYDRRDDNRRRCYRSHHRYDRYERYGGWDRWDGRRDHYYRD